MNILKNIFRSKEKEKIDNIRALAEEYSALSIYSLDPDELNSDITGSIQLDPKKSIAIYLWIFGAIDILCQVESISPRVAIDLLKEILISVAGIRPGKDADEQVKVIIQTTASPFYGEVMTKGGKCFQRWSTDQDANPGQELSAILESAQLMPDLDDFINKKINPESAALGKRRLERAEKLMKQNNISFEEAKHRLEMTGKW